jgi:hypothetical protein
MDTVKSTIEKKNNDRQVSEEDQSGDGDDMEVTTPSQSAHIDEKEQQASSDGDDVEVTAPAQSTHIDEKEQQKPFPDRIEGFGYRWNERGQLRSVVGDIIACWSYLLFCRPTTNRSNMTYTMVIGRKINNVTRHSAKQLTKKSIECSKMRVCTGSRCQWTMSMVVVASFLHPTI